GTAAVGDDFDIFRDRLESLRQLVVWDRSRSGDVTVLVLGRRTYVDHDDVAALQPSRELVLRDGLETVALTEVRSGEPLDFGRLLGGEVSQLSPETTDTGTRVAVEDLRPTTL